MSDLDKTFDPDEPIQQIAEDLNRIKKVADLLRRAQSSVDTVLSASEEVISKAGDFAANSTKILQRLDDVDLDGRLTEIQEALSEARGAIGNSERRMTAYLGEISETQTGRDADMKTQLATVSLKQSEASKELASAADQLAKELDKVKRSLDAYAQRLDSGQEAQAARMKELLDLTQKRILIAVGAGIILVAILIVLQFLA